MILKSKFIFNKYNEKNTKIIHTFILVGFSSNVSNMYLSPLLARSLCLNLKIKREIEREREKERERDKKRLKIKMQKNIKITMQAQNAHTHTHTRKKEQLLTLRNFSTASFETSNKVGLAPRYVRAFIDALVSIRKRIIVISLFLKHWI